jgi:hypothetical protein
VGGLNFKAPVFGGAHNFGFFCRDRKILGEFVRKRKSASYIGRGIRLYKDLKQKSLSDIIFRNCLIYLSTPGQKTITSLCDSLV